MRTVIFDADTLLDKNKQLRQAEIRRAGEYKRAGYSVGIWSERGVDYADSIRVNFDLYHVFDFAMSKPSVLIDEDDYPLRNTKLELPGYRRGQYV